MSTPTIQPAEHLRKPAAVRGMADAFADVADKPITVPTAEAPDVVLGMLGEKSIQPVTPEKLPETAEILPATVKTPPETVSTEKKGMLDKLPEAPPEKPKPSNREHFKKLEELKNAAEARARELEEKLKGYDPTIAEKVTAAEKRAAELEKQLELHAIERSPAFRQRYVEGRNAIVEQARAIAAELSEGDKTIADRAMMLHGKERREFVDASFESPSAVNEFMDKLRTIDALDAEREAALSDQARKETLAAAAQPAQNEQLVKRFESLHPMIIQKLGAAFAEREGDAEHNRLVADNMDIARSLADGTADENDLAAAPYLAVAARAYMNENIRLKEENAKLRSRIKDYTGSDAGINGAGGDDSDKPATGKPRGMMSIANERFGAR